MKIQLLTTTILVAVFAFPAFADDETDALKAQIKALEARLDKLEQKEAKQQKQIEAQRKALAQQPEAAAQPPLQGAVPAPSPALERRVSALEQQQASTAATTSELQQNAAVVHYDYGKGLTVTSPDNRMQLRMGGYFQADDHTFIGNPSGNNDQFFIRSARPILEASYDNFSARLMMDFGNNQTQLLDAYGDYHADDYLNFRVGKFKDPIGIERWQSEQNVLFAERGMTTNLVPYRDNGVSVYGNLIPGTLEYQLAFTNGSPDLVNGTNGLDNDHEFTGRVFAHPFYPTDIKPLQGLGVGVAGSYGAHDATATSQDVTSGYVTPAQTKFFTYSGATFAQGAQWRVNPQATYYNGPFSAIGEYVVEDQGMQDGTHKALLRNDAWMATATYVLTGENASFDGVVPRNNFDPVHDHWGAFELVARTSRLNVDDAAFPFFANSATSAHSAHETTTGGTWYMNPFVKLNLDFEFTQFDGGLASNHSLPDEKAILTRAQVKF